MPFYGQDCICLMKKKIPHTIMNFLEWILPLGYLTQLFFQMSFYNSQQVSLLPAYLEIE